jgi:hypothetical protein
MSTEQASHDHRAADNVIMFIYYKRDPLKGKRYAASINIPEALKRR